MAIVDALRLRGEQSISAGLPLMRLFNPGFGLQNIVPPLPVAAPVDHLIFILQRNYMGGAGPAIIKAGMEAPRRNYRIALLDLPGNHTCPLCRQVLAHLLALHRQAHPAGVGHALRSTPEIGHQLTVGQQ